MIKLHGIRNCDTVKKARAWLESNDIAYEFHDFQKHGVSAELLLPWIAQVGWEKLVNRQGTTWRKLHSAQQAAVVNPASAIALMVEHSSVIKRPVLVTDGKVLVGFDVTAYEFLLTRG